LASDVDDAFGGIQPAITAARAVDVATVTGGRLGADAALRGAQQDARARVIADPLRFGR
jgi:hypothetical protein